MTNQRPDRSATTACPLCATPGGDVLYEDDLCQVVLVTDQEGKAFPGFCRVISKQHVREMSDLPVAGQRHILDVVLATERAVRQVQQPDKMNLASLGNVVPHVHWHVVPRWEDDSHFPGPIWASPQRVAGARVHADRERLRKALQEALNSVSE